jgi:hypothetical protein
MPPKRQPPTRMHNNTPEDHSVDPGCLSLKRYCQQHNDFSNLKRTEVPAGDSYINSRLLTACVCVCERHGEYCQNGAVNCCNGQVKPLLGFWKGVAYCENSIRMFPSNKAVSNMCAISSVSGNSAESCTVCGSQ